MFKSYLLVTGVALLFAGPAHADNTEAQAMQARAAIAKKEAPAPSATSEDLDAARRQGSTNEATEELHPDARPVYLNGGYFGGE